MLTNTKRSYTIWYVIACNPYKIKGGIRNVRKESTEEIFDFKEDIMGCIMGSNFVRSGGGELGVSAKFCWEGKQIRDFEENKNCKISV